MGTPLGPKYIPYTYMDPLGKLKVFLPARSTAARRPSKAPGTTRRTLEFCRPALWIVNWV